MTSVIIDDVLPRSQFTASASQTVFNTNWTVDSTSDVVVYARAAGVDADDDTQLVSTTDYNVTLIGAQETVRVTFLSGRTVGDIITIIRATPVERQNIYTNTNFTPSMLNSDFARLVLIGQQNELDRGAENGVGVRYNYSEEITLPKDQILPILPAGHIWRMNSDNTAIETVDFGDGDGDAPADAKYYVGEADAQLPDAKNLGALASGLLKHTVTSGESTPATAINAVDYWAPGDDLTTPNPPVNGDDVVNKQYADAIAAGFNFEAAVRVASTANFSSTYDNGASGIGATLTASSNGAASIDSVSLALNDRALFKDQTNGFENGIYYVSQVGDGSNPAIYTRSTDFDEPSEIGLGALVYAREGTTNQETFWVQDQVVNTVGTDNINFDLFGLNPSNIVTIDGVQTITGAKTFSDLINVDNIRIDGNQVSTTNTNGNLIFDTNGSGDIVFKMGGTEYGRMNNDVFYWNTTTAATNSKFNIVNSTAGIFTASTSMTDTTPKTGTFAVPHYTNSEEPLGVVVGRTTLSDTIVDYGGGGANLNTATSHRIYAAANNTTTTGTQVAQFDINGFTLNASGSTADIIRDEDDMVSDDANALATQQSIKAYVDRLSDFISNDNTTGTALSNGIDTDLTSISLPPGDWDVEGSISIQGAGTNLSYIYGWVSSVSATLPSIPFYYNTSLPTDTASTLSAPPPSIRFTLASTTTIYLSTRVGTTAGATGYGTIQAKRIT